MALGKLKFFKIPMGSEVALKGLTDVTPIKPKKGSESVYFFALEKPKIKGVKIYSFEDKKWE